MADEKPSLDIFGIKPIADSINTLSKGVVDGTAALLGRICLPAAEEYGLLLRDKVHAWRARNISAIAAAAERKLEAGGYEPDTHAHPRLVSTIIDEGSWIDDGMIQEMWGGLLASSCTPDGDDDSNLIFANQLSQLTKLQARLLRHLCENSEKTADPTGLVYSKTLRMPLEALQVITGENDIYRLDREMDHLREIGLIESGFEQGSAKADADVTPTALALNMYVWSEGSRLSPADFFDVVIPGEPLAHPS
ncbi:MAG: hypothetical protein Q8K89_04075 [Actinomycetota bacterium]|nr:hypothetical protein [Actinomycetota bacterium]